MKITKEQIKSLGPCNDGWRWYLNNQEEDLLTLMLTVNSDETAIDQYGYFQGDKWARRIFSKLASPTQNIEIAIFAVECVIATYEKDHPGDDRPRKEICAAKKCPKNPSVEAAAGAALAAAGAALAAAGAGVAGADLAAALAAAGAGVAGADLAAALAALTAGAAFAADAAGAADVAGADFAADALAARAAGAADAIAARAAALAEDKKDLQEKIIRFAAEVLDQDLSKKGFVEIKKNSPFRGGYIKTPT